MSRNYFYFPKAFKINKKVYKKLFLGKWKYVITKKV